MRSRLLIVCALTLAACSGQPDVIVTEASSAQSGSPLADEQTPPTTPTSTTTVASPSVARAADRDRLRSLLLTETELPGWQVASAMTVGGEPTFNATDCPLMNDVWSIAALPGERRRGVDGAIDVRYRNTAVVVEDAAEADRLLDAVATVWETCPLFSEEYGEWWSEPIETPSAAPGTRPSEWNSAAIVLGNSDGITDWTIAVWQFEATLVVLEVQGDGMWSHLDDMFDVMSAHLDGRPIPELADVWSDITDLQNPSDELPAGVEPPTISPIEPPTLPPSTLPPATAPTDPDLFPPVDEEWGSHPLARIAPQPGELGVGWQFERASVLEAEPSDPNDEFPGCPGTAPPTMDGLDITYHRPRPERVSVVDLGDEIQITLGAGDQDAAERTVDALRAIFDCPDSVAELGAQLAAAVPNVPMTADDALILTFRTEDSLGIGLEILSTIGIGRYDDLLVVVVSVTAEPSGTDLPQPQDHADGVAALIEQVASRR